MLFLLEIDCQFYVSIKWPIAKKRISIHLQGDQEDKKLTLDFRVETTSPSELRL